ncbi:hypothetical protein HAX54_037857, partial [Datura stramonium]|nr:hypothetical protein [Datura stramonium]
MIGRFNRPIKSHDITPTTINRGPQNSQNKERRKSRTKKQEGSSLDQRPLGLYKLANSLQATSSSYKLKQSSSNNQVQDQDQERRQISRRSIS